MKLFPFSRRGVPAIAAKPSLSRLLQFLTEVH
jgi:hypothetical protein